MATARDVANYMASQVRVTGETQMHKLLYYAQAWSLAWDGKPLFDEDIEAWANGPVVRSMRRVVPTADLDAPLTDREKSVAEAVGKFYGCMPGKRLSCLTHSEEPWQEAREGLAAGQPGQTPISRTTMARTYGRQALRGKGPHRPAQRPGPSISTDRAIRAARRISEDWPETLRLLAE